jgi:hypothetical protein
MLNRIWIPALFVVVGVSANAQGNKMEIADCIPHVDYRAHEVVAMARDVLTSKTGTTIGACRPAPELGRWPLIRETVCPLQPLYNEGVAIELSRLIYRNQSGQPVEVAACGLHEGDRRLPMKQKTAGCPLVHDWWKRVSYAGSRWVLDDGRAVTECTAVMSQPIAMQTQSCGGDDQRVVIKVDGTERVILGCQPAEGKGVTFNDEACTGNDASRRRYFFDLANMQTMHGRLFTVHDRELSACVPNPNHLLPTYEVVDRWEDVVEGRYSKAVGHVVMRDGDQITALSEPKPMSRTIAWIPVSEQIVTAKTVTISCASIAVPEKKIRWKKGNGQIVETVEPTLSLAANKVLNCDARHPVKVP